MSTPNRSEILLAEIDLRNCQMWAEFQLASANHDLVKYGEWSCNHAEAMGEHQKSVEAAMHRLRQLLEGGK